MLLIGLGGLCKDLLHDILQQYSPEELLFYTEYENDAALPFFYAIKQLRVTCKLTDAINHLTNVDKRFLVLIGDNNKRYNMVKKMEELGGTPHFYISKKAMANPEYSKISTRNVIIMMFVSVGADVTISEGVVLYPYCAVAHDSTIGEYAFMSSYSVGSKFSVGAFSFIGLHATILPGIKVGANSIIGAGAVVTKDVPNDAVAYGMPAVLKPKKAVNT